MKKMIVWMLAMMLMASLAGCAKTEEKKTETNVETTAEVIETTAEESEETVQIPNPWQDCETLAEAEQVAGFSYRLGEAVKNGEYQAVAYRATEGMLEIIYEKGDSSLTIRQAPGEGQDISGDYNEYSHDFTVSECGVEEIRLRGTKDVIYETDFSWDGYSYNICSDCFDYDSMGTVVGEVTGQAYDPNAVYEELEEEAMEGAPVVSEDRRIDEAAVPMEEIAGLYTGETYAECSVSIYTDRSGDSAEIGTILVSDDAGDAVFDGTLIQVMDNFYEIYGLDVNFTVYTEEDTLCLDFYVDGEHTDYLTMTEHFES